MKLNADYVSLNTEVVLILIRLLNVFTKNIFVCWAMNGKIATFWSN